MVHVWYSNQLERLAARLIENLESTDETPAARLFTKRPIIVPNQSIETYLKYEIARGTGIGAAFEFQLTESFLTKLLPKRDPPPKLLTYAQLRALFLDLFSSESAVRPLPEAVQNYLAPARDDANVRGLRQFQLASRLAGLARQYGDTRPELLQAWAKGLGTLDGNPLEHTEQWQRDLSARLIELVTPKAGAGIEQRSRWILPQELFGFLEREGLTPPGEIHIFGFSYVWHGLRAMITHLLKTSIIHIYTLAPFIEFSEDVHLLQPALKVGLRFRSRKVTSAKVTGHDEPMTPDDLPIVAHWGRPGQEYFSMLAEFDGTSFGPDFVKSGAKTVLGRLQNEILERTLEVDAPLMPDRSLVILASSGIRREAEAVANEIWKLMREDDRRPDSTTGKLRFCDIAVLLGDRTNQGIYQAHFRAVFEDMHGIPFNMVELPLAGECRVIEAVFLLLGLPLGEFTRPEMLKILGHPAVRGDFPKRMPIDGATGAWSSRSYVGPIKMTMRARISTEICFTGNRACAGWCSAFS